jgi:aryl-phospho-beta-D-glucosidase BglC (GH1 family)
MRTMFAALLLAFGLATPAVAEPGSLLPAGWLHTNGNQILGPDNAPVRIAAIGWNGGDGGRHVPEGLYTVNYRRTMDSMKDLGFNTIRLPWCDQWLGAHANDPLPVFPGNPSIDYKRNPDLRGLTALQINDRIVAYAGQIGLKIIFDHHNNECKGGQQTNGLWYDDNVSAATFEANWLSLAHRYKGNPTIIGYDLDNEPLEAAGWGVGGANDWHAEAQKLGRLLQAVDPGPLIIVEGPQTYNPRPNMPRRGPEGNLEGVRTHPVVLSIPNKLVYSVHEYPPSVADIHVNREPALLVPHMNRVWGFVVRDNIAPVWIGEMGSSMQTPVDASWAETMVRYLNGGYADQGGPVVEPGQQGIGWDWWSWGHLDGWVPDGVLADWDGRPRPRQYAIVSRMLMRPVTETP